MVDLRSSPDTRAYLHDARLCVRRSPPGGAMSRHETVSNDVAGLSITRALAAWLAARYHEPHYLQVSALLEHDNGRYSYTRIWNKPIRGGKGTRGESEACSHRNK